MNFLYLFPVFLGAGFNHRKSLISKYRRWENAYKKPRYKMLPIELTSTQSKLDTKHSNGSVVSALAVRALEQSSDKMVKPTIY